MEDEEPCQVCVHGHSESRRVGFEFTLPCGQPGENFTGPAEVLRQDYLKDQALDRYERLGNHGWDVPLLPGLGTSIQPPPTELLPAFPLDPCQERGIPDAEEGRTGVDSTVRGLLVLLPAAGHLSGGRARIRRDGV